MPYLMDCACATPAPAASASPARAQRNRDLIVCLLGGGSRVSPADAAEPAVPVRWRRPLGGGDRRSLRWESCQPALAPTVVLDVVEVAALAAAQVELLDVRVLLHRGGRVVHHDAPAVD